MDNPWLNLPAKIPFILDSDRQQVESFNRNVQSIHHIYDDLLPEPYMGNPKTASVILLSLNPGYSQSDYDFYSDPTCRQACLQNLAHTLTNYPFYLLNPAYRQYSGSTWWFHKLKWLIGATSLEQVASHVCCIEYFPYHSPKFGPWKSTLPSQAYNFGLLEEALAANKPILIMRAKRYWEEAVPNLKNYDCFTLRSTQRAWISANNVNGDGFARIVKKISR